MKRFGLSAALTNIHTVDLQARAVTDGLRRCVWDYEQSDNA